MPDITALIMNDHAWFRQQFASLDELQARPSAGPGELSAIWAPLAARLDVHALAEERISTRSCSSSARTRRRDARRDR